VRRATDFEDQNKWRNSRTSLLLVVCLRHLQ
jgi:hypothetical protein